MKFVNGHSASYFLGRHLDNAFDRRSLGRRQRYERCGPAVGVVDHFLLYISVFPSQG
ncbi:hypothetical protein [Photorhabdus temperata]|uniref:hypothetical protein n=1 Tax=Photorhabdus temperata TaxID=574560 RepID=UPI0013646202|nr:hypothetical protein [Photorhabdus temperata]